MSVSVLYEVLCWKTTYNSFTYPAVITTYILVYSDISYKGKVSKQDFSSNVRLVNLSFLR